jgi:hypothetical protein
MSRRIAVLTLALCAAIPAAVQASPAAAAANTSVSIPLTEGGAITVSFTPAVGTQQQLAQDYVAFLESLPHGTELGQLKVLVATPNQVEKQCDPGHTDPHSKVLGCYLDNTMTVPSTGLDTATAAGDYTVRYVLTHEYGHHIAAHRSNALGAGGALAFGPKYWASYEMVCDLTGQKKLFPYDEANMSRYLRNPGEAWAETYARLVYPDQPWTWTSLLRPDDGALAAARQDVLAPWTKNTTQTFTMDAGRDHQTFDLPLTLDGALKATVRGPSGSEVNVKVTSGSQNVGESKRSGAYDVWSTRAGCRERPTETLSFAVSRAGGASGPVTLRLSYAG